ncbi:MAG: hypothetical protein HYV62_13650 [Candidatus Rokubacteria bacterium]|nr:hypothetical protein [Candidatus Rokubacteria bacterium]
MTTVSRSGSSVKGFVDSVVTSGLPPDEMLQRLDQFGIEWYITEQGDLMIKSWQIGAEGFLSPEQVGRIRMGRLVPPEANALEWVSQNLEDLRRRYGGQWIAVAERQVVVSAFSLPELLHQCRAAGITRPFVTEIPAAPVIWTTTYAG